jgi:hypothetical protein
MTGESNDGRFPDHSAVLARYPIGGRQPASDRQAWPWLAGTIEQQCGPDEWLVTIEGRRVVELKDGSPAPAGTPDGDLDVQVCLRHRNVIPGRAGSSSCACTARSSPSSTGPGDPGRSRSSAGGPATTWAPQSYAIF